MSQLKKKIAFIGTDWNNNEYRRKYNKYGGCSYYRLVKPMELLKPKYDVQFYNADLQKLSEGKRDDEFFNEFTYQHDMVIIKQVDNPQAAQALHYWCKENNTILVQDFDDNILMIREDQPAYKAGYGAGGQKMAFAFAFMSLIDAMIVSTQPLKDSYSKFLKKLYKEEKDIYVFPNYNDIKDWNYLQPKKDPNKVVIGWAGSITHDKDLKEIMKTLGKVVEKYPNVYVEFLGGTLQGTVGYLLEDWSEESKKRFKVLFGTNAIDEYFAKMRSQTWDIGIAPLVDDEFNRGKSHIKWMEYAMCGLPTIASMVYPYYMPIGNDKTIVHNETGLLANNQKDWEEQLSYLIENQQERQRLAENAYNYIEENLQWKHHKKDYLAIVDDIFLKKANK